MIGERKWPELEPGKLSSGQTPPYPAFQISN